MPQRDEAERADSEDRTYAEYLRLDALLSLQVPPARDGAASEHDERLFITIHQVYEIWFGQLLHEIDFLRCALRFGDHTQSEQTLARILRILKTLVSQVDILETMTPVRFLGFRDRLRKASGLESRQFRELETVLGAKRPEVAARFSGADRAALERRRDEPSLWAEFLHYLAHAGYDLPESVTERDPRAPTEASKAVQAVLLEAYRSDPATAQLCERLVDLDEGLQEWRYRHVKMVERTIGSRGGTGGSSGSPYLRATLFRPLFPDLWELRDAL